MTDPVGGRYRLIEELGRGAMGVVWKAHDEQLERDVAVKEVVLPGWLSGAERRQRHERTMREARSAARLTHPGIVTVHDVVVEDGCPWIVMELVEAPTLAVLVAESGGLPPTRAAAIGLHLLGALQAAHTAGVLHRDIKPGNVLVAEGRTVLTDFGIARMEGDPTLTSTGAMIGTPAFMAPELFTEGGEPSPASDLWSIGATLYFAVEGRRPYEQTDLPRLIAALTCDRPAPSPSQAGALAPVIEGLLRKDPGERLTGGEVLPLLEAAAVPARVSGPLPALDPEPREPAVGEPAVDVQAVDVQAVETRFEDSGPEAEAVATRTEEGAARMQEAGREAEDTRPRRGDTARAATDDRADVAGSLDHGRSGMGRTMIAAVAPVVAALAAWGLWSAWPGDPPAHTPVGGTPAKGHSAGGMSSTPAQAGSTPTPTATPAADPGRFSLTLPSGWREHSAGVFVKGNGAQERITVRRLAAARNLRAAMREAEPIVASKATEPVTWNPRNELVTTWRYTFCRVDLTYPSSVQSVMMWRPARTSRAMCLGGTSSAAIAQIKSSKGSFFLIEMSWVADQEADEEALRRIAGTIEAK